MPTFNFLFILFILISINILKASQLRGDDTEELLTENFPVLSGERFQSDSNHRKLSSCNLTLYKEWLNERYDGVLAANSKFWLYQTQTQVVLNNFLALQNALTYCKRQFQLLYFYRAGRMGPINIQDAYKQMCNDYCLENDNLHQIAMRVSGCSCIELSTQEGDLAYTREGDWCYHNTARLLCDTVGYCGVWDCDLDDFMCPRYEWDKKRIPLKGPGTCIRGAAINRKSLSEIAMTIIISMSLAGFLMYIIA